MNNLDKKIKEIVSKDLDLPEKYTNSIVAVLNRIDQKKSFKYKKLKLSFATAFCSLFLITGIVFAKDIEIYFKSLFANSNKAIDAAVENGFVQKEEMDFVYDNSVGIKLDSLVLDDLNLNISFIFETKKENIKSIRFNNFSIKNDNEKVIYRSEFKYEESIENVPLYSSFSWKEFPVKITETTFADSILIGLRPEFEEFNELYFDIKSIDITYIDGQKETINGTWNFNIFISDEMKRSTNINYNLKESNEYIKSATAILSPTGMLVKLDLKNKLDREFNDTLLMYVLKCNGKEYTPERIERSEEYIELRYSDIGIYMEDYEIFDLYIEYYNTELLFSK